MKPTSMKKLVGVGLSVERDKVMREITKLGCVEITSAKERDSTLSLAVHADIDGVNIKLAKLAFANSFIREQLSYAERVSKNVKQTIVVANENGDEQTKKVKSPLMEYKAAKKPFLVPKPELDFDEFMMTDINSSEVFVKIAQLESLSIELSDIKASENKSAAKIKAVYPYRSLANKLSKYRSTAHTYAVLGGIASKRIDEFNYLNSTFEGAVFEVLQDMSQPIKNKFAVIPVAAMCLKEEREAVIQALNDVGFTEVNFREEHSTAKDIIIAERANIIKCRDRRKEIVNTIITNYESYQFLMERRLAEDYYNIRLQMIKAEELMRSTKSCYVFEAWVPSTCEDAIDKSFDKFTLAYLIREPEDDEIPPTLLNDNAVVYPYQSVTNMFSIPAHNEVNPNPLVTFFFVLFFGVMLSDAVYGLILSVGAGIVLLKMKPRKYEMAMVKIIFMGGLSTIVWGILFGSYLGYTLNIAGVKYYLFNPIEDPMSMLILSLGLGLVQMLTGMAVNAYALFRQHKYADAIFGVFPWYFLVGGIALMFTGNQTVSYIAYGVLAVGVIGLMIGGSLHKKGIKKISSGVSKLYSLINFFSDLMSYTRLFGLGLATGVIAYVFNTLGTVFIDMIPIFGYVLAIAIMIIGHVFNIGINTLGAYVHNSRLQFVEFFGRFYTGGGYLFKPLGSNKKYYNFTLKEVN